MTIKVYRKEAKGYDRPKPSKAEFERMVKLLDLSCRVRRPAIESLFIPASYRGIPEFYRMVELPTCIIRNRAIRILDYSGDGFIVPESDLGKAEGYNATQSVLLWIKKNLSPVVNADHVAVVQE